jgi:hypothetical protein
MAKAIVAPVPRAMLSHEILCEPEFLFRVAKKSAVLSASEDPMAVADALKFLVGWNTIVDDEPLREESFLSDKMHESERRRQLGGKCLAEFPTDRPIVISSPIYLSE